MRKNYLTRMKGSIVNTMALHELDKPDIVKCKKIIMFIDKILIGKVKEDIPAYLLNFAKMLEYSSDKKLREIGSIFKQMYETGIEGVQE